MIYYRLYQNKNTKVGNAGEWYARACYTGTVSLDELAQHMSNHNTPYSAGAIKGVLTDMVSCIRELLLEGKQVKIPDLAIFQAGISSTGSNTKENFTVSRNIARVSLKARGTGDLRLSKYDDGVSIREWSAE